MVRGRWRRLVAYAASAALVVTLTTGCSLDDEEDALRAWVTSQSQVAEVTSVEASTGSIGYAFAKRGVASVDAAPGTDAADLRALGASLATHLAGGPAFKEVRLTVSVGPDKVTLQGRRPLDEAVIAAWTSLRALPGIESISLLHRWHSNGLGQDARTRADLEWTSAGDLFAQLPAATTALAAWSPSGLDWSGSVAGGLRSPVRVSGAEAAALPGQVATLLAPLAEESEVMVTVGHQPRYAPRTGPAVGSPDRPTDVALSVPNAEGALRVHDALRATGARPPSALKVSGGRVTLTGVDEFSAQDRASLEALLDDGRVVRLGPGGFVVTLRQEGGDLPAVAARVAPERSLRVEMGTVGSTLEDSVEAPAGEVVALWQRYAPVRDLPEVSRFRVGPDTLSLHIRPLASTHVTAAAKALRAAGWSGTKRVTLNGAVTPDKAWIPVSTSFDSTSTGKGVAVDLPKPQTGASEKEAKAVTDAGRGMIRDWDATATTP